jgi:hypothetical protein
VARLRQRGFWLEYASMAWMTAEAAVAITAGVIASSVALVGFGLDSVIEFAAAAIVVWQLRVEGQDQDRETRAVRLIGVTFFALAVYLTVEGIRDLAGHARPEQSIPGLAVAAAALIVMPLLAVAKRRSRERVLRADLGGRPARRRPERLARLVAGRPHGGPGHRRPGRQGGPGSLGRRRLTAHRPVHGSGTR